MGQATAPSAASVPFRQSADRPFVAIALVLAAVAIFSGMDAISKALAEDYDPIEIVWGRYVAILLMLLPFALHRPRSLLSARPGQQFVRGVCVLGSALLFIGALARLPIADATAIGFASPLMVTALSIPLLGERVGPRRWSAVAVGFVGVLIVVRPGSGAIGTAGLLPLCSAACWAVSLIVTRRMRANDGPITMLLYSTLIGLVLSSFALPFVWRPPTLAAWALIVFMGVLSTVGQYLLIAGLMRSAASLLAPFTYSQMIWSTLLGYLVFDAVPTAWTWCGAAVIVGSGIYIAHRERVTSRAVSP